MKITNKLNLPNSFVNYELNNTHECNPNKYSVTELLLPIRQILLSRIHYDDIEKDISDSIPALFGTAVHQILENNTTKDPLILSEESVSYNFGDIILSGRIDLLNLRDESIEDYKTCSVSKIVKEDFEDWKMQGLMYAFLVFKQRGIIIRHLKFYALMKDWSKIKSAMSSNYPSSAIYVWKYEIQDSDYDYIERWINLRLELISKYIESNTLPECTDEEKWYTGTKYAVYKKIGDKKASIICDTEEEAHNYITYKCDGAGEIEIRKGENIKCNYYCEVCKFCKERRKR